jgi:hypothetical protein
MALCEPCFYFNHADCVGCTCSDASHLSDPRANHPGKAFAGAPVTTREAALLVTPRSGTQRDRVLQSIVTSGGLTDEEMQVRLSMSGDTQRPRRIELVEGGWVHDGGQRRRTASGERAIVWELTEAGRQRSQSQVLA